MQKKGFKKNRVICPKCGVKAFAPFKDSEDNSEGHCHCCNETIFNDTEKRFVETKFEMPEANKSYYVVPQREISNIKANNAISTLSRYLVANFPNADKAMKAYRLLSNDTKTAVYQYIDEAGNVSALKYMQYLENGHRDKENSKANSYEYPDFQEFKQKKRKVLFGSHLLATAPAVIGVVESEKTAIILRCFFPEIVFLATGGSAGFSFLRIVLNNDQNVIIYPDGDAYNQWLEVAEEYSFSDNWKFSKLAKELEPRQDVADILEADKDFAKKMKTEIAEFFGAKISIYENKYYMTILEGWKPRDFELMFQRYNIVSISPLLVKDDKKFKTIFLDENKQEFHFTQVLGKNLRQFCIDYQIINYQDMQEEKFTFQLPLWQIRDFVNYSKTFFGGMTYYVDNHTFDNQNYNEILISKMEKLNSSNFCGVLKKDVILKLVADCENQHNQAVSVDFPKKSLGYYGDILERGEAYLKSLQLTKQSDIINYYFGIFVELWNVSENDFACFLLFCIASQKLKLQHNSEIMRALIVSGAGGLGKDNVLTCFVLGELRKFSNNYFSGKENGATNFSAFNTEIANKILINIISDDIEGLNQAVKLDNITTELYKIETKGIDVRQIRRRFLTLATTNKTRCLFIKDSDEDAFARRFLLIELNKVAKTQSYRELTLWLINNKEKANDFFAGWFFLCNQLTTNGTYCQNLIDKTYNYMLTRKADTTYSSEIDDVIIATFQKYLTTISDGFNISNVHFIERDVLIKSVKPLVQLFTGQRIGYQNISKTLQAYYGDNAIFNKTHSYKGSHQHCFFRCDYDIAKNGLEQKNQKKDNEFEIKNFIKLIK